MSDPNLFPTQEQLAKDTVVSALSALTRTTNPCFDQILWDPVRHVLSLRLWPGEYANLVDQRRPTSGRTERWPSSRL